MGGVSGMLDPEMSMNLAGILGESLSDYMHVCMHHIIYACYISFVPQPGPSACMHKHTHTHTGKLGETIYRGGGSAECRQPDRSGNMPRVPAITRLECLL